MGKQRDDIRVQTLPNVSQRGFVRPVRYRALHKRARFGHKYEGTFSNRRISAFALEHGEWWTFLANRRFRGAAAQSLRRIGTPQALEALKTIASRGPAGARAAARAQLAGMD